MSARHAALVEIDQKVKQKYKEMYNKELADPYGRHASDISGEKWVHPDEDARILRLCKDYRIRLLEAYIVEHC